MTGQRGKISPITLENKWGFNSYNHTYREMSNYLIEPDINSQKDRTNGFSLSQASQRLEAIKKLAEDPLLRDFDATYIEDLKEIAVGMIKQKNFDLFPNLVETITLFNNFQPSESNPLVGAIVHIALIDNTNKSWKLAKETIQKFYNSIDIYPPLVQTTIIDFHYPQLLDFATTLLEVRGKRYESFRDLEAAINPDGGNITEVLIYRDLAKNALKDYLHKKLGL